ncbi:MAG TPA: VOC family protein [Chloroflexota bacterium]|nr:VOC family protein [Chloroflexota bacterium]
MAATAASGPRLGHVAIRVHDGAATRRFYEQGLGLRFLRSDVKLREVPAGPPPPAGSFKVADPDGNVVDVTGNPAEWRV